MEWYVNTTESSAVKGTDYNADGATLQFVPGQTQRCKIASVQSITGLCILLINIKIEKKEVHNVGRYIGRYVGIP